MSPAKKKKTVDGEADLTMDQVDILANLIAFFNEIVTALIKASGAFVLIGGGIFLLIIFGLLFFFKLLGF